MSDQHTSPDADGGELARRREEQAVLHAYRQLQQVQPSPALDRRVLAAAASAREASPARQPRWFAPLGLAASVVLALGLVLQLRHATDPPVPPAKTEAPALSEGAQAPLPAADSPATSSSATLERLDQAAGAAPDAAPAPASEAAYPAAKSPPALRRDLYDAGRTVPADPATVEAWLALARSLVQRGETGQARLELQRLLESHPDSAEARALLASLPAEPPR